MNTNGSIIAYSISGAGLVAWASQIEWIIWLTGLAILVRLVVDVPKAYKVLKKWRQER